MRHDFITAMTAAVIFAAPGVGSALPDRAASADDTRKEIMRAQLDEINTTIAIYNALFPALAYDSSTVIDATFWDPLIATGLLSAAPVNPLQDTDNVCPASGHGCGWVWRVESLKHPDDYAIFAVGADDYELELD